MIDCICGNSYNSHYDQCCFCRLMRTERITHLAGRCRTGSEPTGVVTHIVDGNTAICGREPGRSSAGWSEHTDSIVTCPKCKAKLEARGPIKMEKTLSKSQRQIMDEYHADFSRVSASMLKVLHDDPVVYFDTYIAKTQPPKPQTKPMEIGSIIHAVLLDGRPLRSVVSIYPDHEPAIEVLKALTGPKRDALLESGELAIACKAVGMDIEKLKTVKGGAEMKAVLKELPQNCLSKDGKLLKYAKEYEASKPEYRYFLKRTGSDDRNPNTKPSFQQVSASIAALKNNDDFYFLFEDKDIIRERPLYWTDPITGQECRCCPDFWKIRDRTAFIWDLKISEYATDFEKQMNNLDYWIQDEHYSAGIRANFPDVEELEYHFLAHKPYYPFHTTINRFRTGDRERIRTGYRNLLDDLEYRKTDNDWKHDKTRTVNECCVFERTI